MGGKKRYYNLERTDLQIMSGALRGGKGRGLSAALLSHFRGMVHNFVLEDSVEEKLLSPFPWLSVAKKKDLSMRRRWVSALDAPPRCTKEPLSHLGPPPAHEAKRRKHRGEEQTHRECLSSTRRKIGRRVSFFFSRSAVNKHASSNEGSSSDLVLRLWYCQCKLV